MSLILPPLVAPFRITLDEPLTEVLLQEICEVNDVFHIEREPDGQLSARKIANGVELAWLVDPHREVVEIYRPGKPVEEQEGHSAVYGDGPVSGFVLELGRIWG